MPPYAGIIRVSHVGGRAGETFHSDRDQQAALEGEAKRRGIDVVLLPPELDVSGSLPLEKRPSLQAAVKGVERGEYAGIIVAYLSRLGRNVREQLRVWDLVEQAGGSIIVVQEGFDTNTAAGRFQRTVMLGVAEMELDLHRERFDQLRAWATQAGVWQRRQTPLGYSRDPDTRGLVPDDDADKVRDAFLARAGGATVVSIADRLGMTTSGVRALLKNRVYLGELRVGEHVNPTAHQPIVDAALFHSVQTATSARAPRSGRDVALLAGLVRCQSCGHAMTRSGNNYGCVTRHSAGRCPRPAHIGQRAVDEYVTAIGLQESRDVNVSSDAGGSITDAADALRAAQEELDRFLTGVTAAGISPDDYASAARTRQDAVTAARDQLAKLSSLHEPASGGDPDLLWERLSVRQRNHVLRGFIECVVVRPVGRGQRVSVADRCIVLERGAGIVSRYQGGGAAMPIEPIGVDGDHPAALRLQLPQD